MTPDHRPTRIKQRQGTDRKGEPRGEWMTGCECGWVSGWDHRHWAVHVDLNKHFEQIRAQA